MSTADRRFHEQWYGMAQPSEGLVVSIPVLLAAQCAEKQSREAHAAFVACLEEDTTGHLRISDLPRLLETVLDLGPARFDAGDALPADLSLYVPEGKQLLRPTRALKWNKPRESTLSAADSTPSAEAGRPYAMLVWEVPPSVTKLDKPETATGAWEYPAQAKFERLLRACRVDVGILSNGYEMRLVYAPHGESSGWLAFRTADMAQVSGRCLFDAFVMLLSRERWFGVAADQQLPSILAQSRKHNADVTTDLASQVFEALEALLAGFSAADERDGTGTLRALVERGDDHLYAGLLTVLLRLVFLLYCEDRGLLPMEHPLFAENYSILGLEAALQSDHGRYPDTMHRRFGAYPRLVALYRAVFLGVSHGDLVIPARRGDLFNPNTFPFLEGWGPEGSAPVQEAEARAAVRLPSVDDLTIHTVLQKLLYLGGQRLSYKALDVEQIGSVYEALMGFAVKRLEGGAVRIRLGSKRGAARVWVEAEALLAVAANQRERWLCDELGFDKNVAAKIAEAASGAKSANDALTAMEPIAGRDPQRAKGGSLVIQPGPERRRTSSHYTPRTLTEPIVERTLEPLIKAMGEAPSSESLLRLVVCDPAVGSGAFLVAACRYLADKVVAAWTREGQTAKIASAHEDVVNHARRLVAQRCLYGVDKNTYAVQLARLSLWLVTMARTEPFTFVDHAIRHGDSLVGLGFEQIRAFDWKVKPQTELPAQLLKEALDEAVGIRKQILELAGDGTYLGQREKERLLGDAEDALERVRLVGDLVVGAFFSGKNEKEREAERKTRLDKVEQWIAAEKRHDWAKAEEIHAELEGMQAELRKEQVPFHWMVEFPEVFYAERPDPLDGDRVNGAAFVDAFVGNPPFAAKNAIVADGGREYVPWLLTNYEDTHGNADISAYFFRRAGELIGNHGAIGFVATNTISQGDTRTAGLAALIRTRQMEIYRADRDIRWAGDAAVMVSCVMLVRGSPANGISKRLDGTIVKDIDSRLRPNKERQEAQPLSTMASLFFMGSKIYGAGFFLAKEEGERLLRNPAYMEVILPSIGGEDINTDPRQMPPDLVISFGQKTLDEASLWPDALAIVRDRVKPERDKANDQTADGAHRKKYWWQYAQPRPDLYRAISSATRCLVTARVSKHLVFSFQPTDRVFNEKLYVFALDRSTHFSVLQSRVHSSWTWLLSSTLKTDLNYSASDCFETFPFPEPDPRAVIPTLESIGERLYEARASYMIATDQGLTKTYNALKNPDCDDTRILELRSLHEQMDRAVLDAYGWSDIPVPPYCPLTDEDKAALQTFEDEVIDRLFALNAERAAAEKKAAPAKPTSTKRSPAKRAASPQKTTTSRAPKSRPRKEPTAPKLPGFEDEDDG
ncbi:MAG: DNA methyltransferase [Polyangiaceae bacterium]